MLRQLVLGALLSLTFSLEVYNEDLEVTHLPGHMVHAVFSFKSTSDSVNEQHFDLLPRPLVSILLNYQIEELHLTLTQGLWKDGLWGYSPHSAAPGGQFLVWFGGSLSDLEERWTHTRNAVSGITCASLSALSSEDTISPKFSLRPTGLTSTKGDSRYVRYGVSPFEVVCTENLTPWIKLLPCGSTAGLASLLDSAKLYNTAYHSTAIRVRRLVCAGCTGVGWEITQTISLVLAPLQLTGRKDWSFRTLFGRTLVASCPVAQSTQVRVATLEDLQTIEITPKEYTVVSNTAFTIDVHNLTTSKILNLYVHFKSKDVIRSLKAPPPILAHTFISRVSSSSSGNIVTIFSNNHDTDIQVLYLQMIPWYLRAYLHTLKLEVLGSPGHQQLLRPRGLEITLAKDRSHPYTIECVIDVPANSNLKLSIQFDPLLLRWNEYPPDAHHGRGVPSGVVSFRHEDQVVTLYTESPLVYLPTPDFSMPFNVLCLVSTVIAIVYGSLFGLTTKDLVCIKETEVKQGLLIQLLTALKGAIKREDKKIEDLKDGDKNNEDLKNEEADDKLNEKDNSEEQSKKDS